jgi:hypothetical protein
MEESFDYELLEVLPDELVNGIENKTYYFSRERDACQSLF